MCGACLGVLPFPDAGRGHGHGCRAREARLASKLNHPHICTVHDVGEADGQAYIAMELVEGQPLSARLEEHELDEATRPQGSLTTPGTV